MPANPISLMYHRVVKDGVPHPEEFVVTQSVFRQQLSYFAQHDFRTPDGSELLNGIEDKPGKRTLIITFDDGYLDNYEYAVPILLEFGFSAIIFPVTDFTRRYNWWDRDDFHSGAPLMMRQQLVQLELAGMQIGSHTVNHASLPSLSPDELYKELAWSKDSLEQILGHSVPLIAYPYGDVDGRVKEAARRAGYRGGFAVNSGSFFFRSDALEIRRLPIYNRADDHYMFGLVSGLEKAFRWSKWASKRMIGLGNRFQQPAYVPEPSAANFSRPQFGTAG